MSSERLREDALEYHSSDPPGKVTVVPTKPHGTQRELISIFPGVAYPCEEIKMTPRMYTDIHPRKFGSCD